jgi:hypothetical protein
MSIHTPLKLNAAKLRVDNNPRKITLKAIMLGIRSLPGLDWKILTESIINTDKNPLTVDTQATE